MIPCVMFVIINIHKTIRWCFLTACGCSLFGSVRDDCEQMTGQCVCKPGIRGKKCNICPEGLVLGPKGCRTQSDTSLPARTCSELECYFGARCLEHQTHAECKASVFQNYGILSVFFLLFALVVLSYIINIPCCFSYLCYRPSDLLCILNDVLN